MIRFIKLTPAQAKRMWRWKFLNGWSITTLAFAHAKRYQLPLNKEVLNG